MVVIATEQLPEGTVAPVKSDSADLIIYIRDINDNAPVCGVFVTAVDIEPELELGSMIINLNCSDADTGLNANISYSLEDSYGILDVNSNGILFLANPLEQANRTALNVRIQATDMGSPSLSDNHGSSAVTRNKNENRAADSLTITVVGRFVNAGEWSFSDRIRIRILTSVDKEGEPISVAWILTLRAVLFACSSGFARKRIPLEFTSSTP